jgi:hypothetical protein
MKRNRPFVRDGAWYCQDHGTWYYWNTGATPPQWKQFDVQVQPPGFSFLARARSGSGPLLIYLTGLAAVLAILFVTVFYVSKNPETIGAVLAPVTGVIGAFTGHAAGHAAAKSH